MGNKDEFTEWNRRSKRNRALTTIAYDRDCGWAKFGNGAVMLWHSDAELKEGEVRPNVAPGTFYLIVNGRTLLFDAEEFRKSLRWA